MKLLVSNIYIYNSYTMNIFNNPEITQASGEIGIMLLGAFILGFVLRWMFTSKNRENNNSEKKYTRVAAVTAPTKGKKSKAIDASDDFTLIEGIGPALEKLLKKNGIESFKDIVKKDVEGLEEVLLEAGKRYAMYNPSTWPDQAWLAHAKKWRELEEYQEILGAGKKKK